jgi:MFS family permease
MPPRARVALTLAVLLVGVYIVLDIVAQLLPPHYNALSQAESDLAVGPYWYVMTANFVVRGVLAIAFLVGLTSATRIGSRSRTGIALLAVWGMGAFLLAIFPTDVGTTETTVHGQLHLLIALIAFLAAAVGVVLLSRHFPEEDRLRAFAGPAYVVGVLTLLFFVIFLVATPVPYVANHAYGLLERIFIGFVLLWMLVVSLCLLQSDARRNTPSSHPGVPRT